MYISSMNRNVYFTVFVDDQSGSPLRYPVWWRPNENVRSYWDPVIARLIWTHPALRRYYKELAGWESSNDDTNRPSLLAILNDYEERTPPVSVACKESKYAPGINNV